MLYPFIFIKIKETNDGLKMDSPTQWNIAKHGGICL